MTELLDGEAAEEVLRRFPERKPRAKVPAVELAPAEAAIPRLARPRDGDEAMADLLRESETVLQEEPPRLPPAPERKDVEAVVRHRERVAAARATHDAQSLSVSKPSPRYEGSGWRRDP